MAQAAQKITLSPSPDIPFDNLVPSQSNVRPILDEAAVESGKFKIPAGGRRFQALSLLLKQKRPAKFAPIQYIVRDAASDKGQAAAEGQGVSVEDASGLAAELPDDSETADLPDGRFAGPRRPNAGCEVI